MNTLRLVIIALTTVATLALPVTAAFADDGGGIITGGKHGGGLVLGGTSTSPASSAEPVNTSDSAATRTITCDLSGAVSQQCQGAANSCVRPPIPPPTNVAVVQQQQPDGSWVQIKVDCNGNGLADETIAVTATMVREQVVRLLPPVAVGIAPASGPTLVNLETIFWSPTPAERALGPVTILGQQVAITIRFDHATYDYGDSTTATTDTPGTAWTPDLCNTAQCPTLHGHTYTQPASSLTARSTITWTATFTVGGGAEQPIPGTIDGPTSTHDLQVLEGRSVLVR